MRAAPHHPPLPRKTTLTLVAAQSIQPLPLGSMFISTSPSTRSGKMSCHEGGQGLWDGMGLREPQYSHLGNGL